MYADGRSWFCGGLGGGRRPGLTLDEDEYVEQVEHELLEQRLYAGAGVCLRTNKGRSLACWPKSASRLAAHVTKVRAAA